MRVAEVFPSRRADLPFPFWVIAAGLCVLHLTLAWYSDDTNLLFSGLIFWPAAAAISDGRMHPASTAPHWQVQIAGLAVLMAIVCRAGTVGGAFLYAYPALVGTSLVFVFFGIQGFFDHRRSLLLLFLLGVPELLLGAAFNPALPTAQFSDILLWYAGFDVMRDGIVLSLPGGSVEVTPACSGLRSMARMLSMAGLVLLALPRRWSVAQMVGLPLFGVFIAFLANGVRVSLLAILIAGNHRDAFESLHGGSTSQLFSIMSILLFMAVVGWIIRRSSYSNSISHDVPQ